MVNLNSIIGKDNTSDKIWGVIQQKFNLSMKKEFVEIGYHFNTLREIRDMITNTIYYSISMDDVDLNFQDEEGLYTVLIKFLDGKIIEIPNELEALEKERLNARYWDDIQHFHETEALSEKESIINKIKAKLIKGLNKHVKAKAETDR